MTTTSRVGSITVHVGSDVTVEPQAVVSDSDHSDVVAVFVKNPGLGVHVQLAGTPDDLRALAQGIDSAATTIEQRRLAKEVGVGF